MKRTRRTFMNNRRSRKKRITFSVRTLLLVIAITALPLGYHVSNANHWSALATLRAQGIKVVFRRDEESWSDSILGDYRTDEVCALTNDNTIELDSKIVADSIASLRPLNEFSVDCFLSEVANVVTIQDRNTIF